MSDYCRLKETVSFCRRRIDGDPDPRCSWPIGKDGINKINMLQNGCKIE